MSNHKLQNIEVEIAGKFYPLLVDNEEAALVRKVENILKGEIDELQLKYGQKINKQDILAMLLLSYTKKWLETTQSEKLTEKIDELYLMLEAGQ
jgi:hypothetical protein